MLLLSDSTFFKLFFYIFAAIIEELIVAWHKFCITSSYNAAACDVSHFCTASFRSSSSSNRLPPRNFFRCRKKLKSLGAKSGLYAGWSICSHLNEVMRSWVWAAERGRALSWSKRMVELSIPRFFFFELHASASSAFHNKQHSLLLRLGAKILPRENLVCPRIRCTWSSSSRRPLHLS